MSRATVRKREWTSGGKKRTAWVVDYNDAIGKRRQKSFELKKDADAYRNHVVQEVANGLHTPERMTATVEAVAEEYIRTLEDRHRNGARVSRGYLARERAMIRRDIIGVAGPVKLIDLRHTHVQQVIDFVEKRGVRPRTIYEVTNTFKTIVDLAVRREYVRRNVVRDVMKERGTPAYEPVRTFSKEEVAALLKAADGKLVSTGSWAWSRRIRLGVYLAAFCGLRWGEVFGLTLDHVDLENGILRIRHSMDHHNNLKSPKTAAGVRDVPFPQPVRTVIEDWLEEYYLPNERNLLMTGRGAASNCVTLWNGNWHRLLANAGLATKPGEKSLHFHALRHFAASMMVNHNIPITDVARMLGHAHYDMTLKVYAHPLLDTAQQSVAVENMASQIVASGTVIPTGRSAVQRYKHRPDNIVLATKRQQELPNRLKTLREQHQLR